MNVRRLDGQCFAEALPVLQAIMPGFVVTFIFDWLSDAPKPGQFERANQALMSTVVIQVVVEVIRWLALLAGQFHSLGQWTDGVAMGWSVTIAVGSGLLLAKWANNDAIYAICRDLRLTSRSADGEWRFVHRTQKDRCQDGCAGSLSHLVFCERHPQELHLSEQHLSTLMKSSRVGTKGWVCSEFTFTA